MLNPNKATLVETTANPIVAGNKVGIPVHCSPQARKEYNDIATLGRRGNHWARLVVSGIAALSSGRANMDNVFTKKGSGIAYGRGAFYVSLPGVLATFESLDDGTYILLRLKTDDSYFKNQKNALNAGLWRATKQEDIWATKFVSNGKLLSNHRNRYVGVSDSDFNSPQEAAKSVGSGLNSVHDSVRKLVEEEGFDIHYTPGNQRIGGYLNCREAVLAESAPSLRESAQLLAHTMYQSRNNNNITWFSDWGGSGVLTQAMQHLCDQNVKLDKHSILMNHPTTQPSKALALGRELNLDPIDGGQIKGHYPSELVGRLGLLDGPISAYQRLKRDEEYTVKHLANDASENLYSAGNIVTGTIGAVSTAGLLAASSSIAVIGGIAGSMYFISSIVHKYYKGRRR